MFCFSVLFLSKRFRSSWSWMCRGLKCFPQPDPWKMLTRERPVGGKLHHPHMDHVLFGLTWFTTFIGIEWYIYIYISGMMWDVNSFQGMQELIDRQWHQHFVRMSKRCPSCHNKALVIFSVDWTIRNYPRITRNNCGQFQLIQLRTSRPGHRLIRRR